MKQVVVWMMVGLLCLTPVMAKGMESQEALTRDLDQIRREALRSAPELEEMEIRAEMAREGKRQARQQVRQLKEVERSLRSLQEFLESPFSISENEEDLVETGWTDGNLDTLLTQVQLMILEAREEEKKMTSLAETQFPLKKEQARRLTEFRAEMLYMGILTMEAVDHYMESHLEVLEEQIREKQIEEELGKTIELEGEALLLERKRTEQLQQTLETWVKDLHRQLAHKTGRSVANTRFDLKEKQGQVRNLSTEKKLEEARESGNRIELAEEEVRLARDLRSLYAGTGHTSKLRIADLEYQLAQHELEQVEKETVRVLLHTMDRYEEQSTAYETAERAWQWQKEVTEGVHLQKDLGMLSELQQKEKALAQQEAELFLKITGNQLYLAERQVELAQQGVLTPELLDEVRQEQERMEEIQQMLDQIKGTDDQNGVNQNVGEDTAS